MPGIILYTKQLAVKKFRRKPLPIKLKLYKSKLYIISGRAVSKVTQPISFELNGKEKVGKDQEADNQKKIPNQSPRWEKLN